MATGALTALAPSPAEAAIYSCIRSGASSPATGLHYNDPWEQTRGARAALLDRISTAPAGSRIRLTTWKLTDSLVTDCLIRAYKRGVTVQMLLPDSHCTEAEPTRLRYGLPGDASWVRCVAQSPGAHTLHQKSVIFDRTGGVPYVTLVGSANLTESSWDSQWNDYFEYAGLHSKDVFSWYAARFNRINAYRREPSRIGGQTFVATDGRAGAWFLPRVADRAHDPEYAELNRIPSASSTTLRVAMFGMNGDRGRWLADELVEKRRAGATVYFIAGPSVSGAIKDKLKAAGIPVHNGYRGTTCEGTNEDYTSGGCRFVHLKMWTTTYWANGVTNYRSYTGSDNWTLSTLRNFDALQRIGGKASQAQFVTMFRDIWDSSPSY